MRFWIDVKFWKFSTAWKIVGWVGFEPCATHCCHSRYQKVLDDSLNKFQKVQIILWREFKKKINISVSHSSLDIQIDLLNKNKELVTSFPDLNSLIAIIRIRTFTKRSKRHFSDIKQIFRFFRSWVFSVI